MLNYVAKCILSQIELSALPHLPASYDITPVRIYAMATFLFNANVISHLNIVRQILIYLYETSRNLTYFDILNSMVNIL